MFPTAGRHHQDTLTSAHRGAATIAPENTMASVDSCIKYGVGNIERDVCISKDSVFYATARSPPLTVPPTVPAPSPNGCPPTSTHWMPALGLRPDLPDNGYDVYRPATQGQEHGSKNHHRLPQRRSAPITESDKGRRHAGKLQLHLQQGVSCQMLQKDGTRGKNPASLHQK